MTIMFKIYVTLALVLMVLLVAAIDWALNVPVELPEQIIEDYCFVTYEIDGEEVILDEG